MCGTWPLLAVWDPRFSRAHRQPQHTFGPSWSVRLPAAPRSVGPAVFMGSPPTHSHKSALTHCEDIRHSMSSAKMPTQPQSTPRPTRDKPHHSTTPTNRAHQQRAAPPMQVNHSVVFPSMSSTMTKRVRDGSITIDDYDSTIGSCPTSSNRIVHDWG